VADIRLSVIIWYSCVDAALETVCGHDDGSIDGHPSCFRRLCFLMPYTTAKM